MGCIKKNEDFLLHKQQQSSKDAATEEITAPLIEKLVKKIKTHRAVIDFDDKFITATVKMEEV
jgi:hypothetical protein